MALDRSAGFPIGRFAAVGNDDHGDRADGVRRLAYNLRWKPDFLYFFRCNPLKSPEFGRIKPSKSKEIQGFLFGFIWFSLDLLARKSPSGCIRGAAPAPLICLLRSGKCSANVPTVDEPRRGADMVARVSTVAFEGVEARPVDVQVQIAAGTVAFTIVGLGDKAVAELRERVRSALIASGPRAAGQAHHRQPRAGRHAEGGQPLRSADRARGDGGDRRHSLRRARRLRGDRRARARRRDQRRRRGAAGGDRRQRRRQGPDLPRPLRPRGGVGVGRSRDPRAPLADPARQPLQGRAGAVPPRAGARAPRPDRSRTCATSRARRAPSGRSRSRRPAATTS